MSATKTVQLDVDGCVKLTAVMAAGLLLLKKVIEGPGIKLRTFTLNEDEFSVLRNSLLGLSFGPKKEHGITVLTGEQMQANADASVTTMMKLLESLARWGQAQENE